MDTLIPINYDSDRPTVSARELHKFLETKTAFKDWFPRMCKYGFTSSVDFNPLKSEQVQNEGGRMVKRTVNDAQLTLDMAKELCMIQRTERGKQARQYFIAVEKSWNDPATVMARALKLADNKIKRLSEKVEQDKSKVLFAEAVSTSESSILIGQLAKMLKQNGIDIGQNRLFDWMRQNGFLIRQKSNNYNLPTQRAMDMGLFRIKESTHLNGDGVSVTTKTTKVTGKGQQYFINRFLGEKHDAS